MGCACWVPGLRIPLWAQSPAGPPWVSTTALQWSAGNAAAAATHCTVANAAQDGNPSDAKRVIDWSAETNAAEFTALNFAPADPIYFDYNVVSGGAGCGNAASDTTVYSFQALGDLDGDTTLSTFTLAAGSNPDNALYRAPGIHSVDPLE